MKKNSQMKICLYSPYFPKHFGGGEKYLLDTAQALTDYGQVYLAIPQQKLSVKQRQLILQRYQRFLGYELKNITPIPSPLGTGASFLKKLSWTGQFDLGYFFSDGSLPTSLAGKNVLHIQVPLARPPLTPLERLKKLQLDFVNTNSSFTKQVVEQYWHLPVNAVHHPMVDVAPLMRLVKKTNKQKIILHVGRFFKQLHSKRQDVLVKFFGHLREQYPKESQGWRLVLIGSVEDPAYAKQVKLLARGLPVKLIYQVTRAELNNWYAKSAIYWHATGFGVNELTHPEKMEHFGISTVEAMASGVVPIVIDRGGQPEVLGSILAELLWTDEKTCLAKTVKFMNNDAERRKMANLAQSRAQNFAPAHFREDLARMMTKLEFTA